MEASEPVYGVVQIAYFVNDVGAAAVRHQEQFGSGPFLISEHIPLAAASHRGAPAEFDHSSAYGQWGQVMIELICVHRSSPPSLAAAVLGAGLHHVARFVPDIDEEAARLTAAGHEQVLMAETHSGNRFAFHGGAGLGHLLEIYEPRPALVQFYAHVARMAQDWHGSDPLPRG